LLVGASLRRVSGLAGLLVGRLELAKRDGGGPTGRRWGHQRRARYRWHL